MKNSMQLCSIHKSTLIGVCVNKECQNPRECCLECIKKLHQLHVQDILDYKEIPTNFQELDQLQLNLQNQFANISQIFEELIKRITVMKQQQNELDKSIKIIVFIKAPDFVQLQKKLADLETELIDQCKKLLIQMEFTEQYPSLKQPKIKLIQSHIINNSCYLCKKSCSKSFNLSCTHKVCEQCLLAQQNCRLCQSQHTLEIGMKYIKQQHECDIGMLPGISKFNPPFFEESEISQQFHKLKTQQSQNQLNRQFKKEQQPQVKSSSKIIGDLHQQEEPQPKEDQKEQSIVFKQLPIIELSLDNSNNQIQFQQCALCKHKFEQRDMFENSYCDHYYCFSCLDEINKLAKIKIICPIQGCNSYFDLEKFEKYYLNYQEILLETLKHQSQLMQI